MEVEPIEEEAIKDTKFPHKTKPRKPKNYDLRIKRKTAYDIRNKKTKPATRLAKKLEFKKRKLNKHNTSQMKN